MWNLFCGIGEVLCVDVKKRTPLLFSHCSIFIAGNIPTENVMAINGLDVCGCGWTVTVAHVKQPPSTEEEPAIVNVYGYDVGLTMDEKERMVRDHFSSCGELKYVHVGYLVTTLHMSGEDAFKAKELDGSYLAGYKLHVSLSVKRPPFVFVPFAPPRRRSPSQKVYED
ncbi:unnamed protein product [Cochlearia groenlandica]